MQYWFSLPRRERFLLVVAAQLESQGTAKRDLVPSWSAVESSGLQLAQRDRFLVGWSTVHRRSFRGCNLLHVGRKSCLSNCRGNTSGAARKSAGCTCGCKQCFADRQ